MKRHLYDPGDWPAGPCVHKERTLTIDICNRVPTHHIHHLPPVHDYVTLPGHGSCTFSWTPAGFWVQPLLCGMEANDDVHTAKLPVLPYPSEDGPSSGFSGSTTSEAAARDQDADGRTKDKQEAALTMLGIEHHLQDTTMGPHVGKQMGMTWAELDHLVMWGHGSTSRVLSDLHKAGRIARLVEERLRCKVYVLPEYVNGRETEPHGGKKSKALAAAEAAIQQVRELHAGPHWCTHASGGTAYYWPDRQCPTIRVLDEPTTKED